MGRQLIVGAGTIGSALATSLADQGHDVVLVSRRGTAPLDSRVHGVAADATNVELLSALAVGADAVFNCANPRYHEWARDWPPLAASLLESASRNDAVLVTLSNLYGYGPVAHAMSESDELLATSTKGRVRAAMWENARAAHEAGRVRATEVRASDFFGPTVRESGLLGERVMPKVLDHATIALLGDLDAPHSWTYVGDVVRALEVAATEPCAWGRPWHVPTAAPLSPRMAVQAIADAAGLDAPKVRRVPWSLVRVAGLFSADVRELHEIAYQFDAPFVVDSSAFTNAFGVEPTPIDEAFGQTVSWWRDERGFPLRSLATAR